MGWNPVTAVRALRSIKDWKDYVSSKVQRSWYSEKFQTFPPDISREVAEAEQRATDRPLESLRAEHTDLFALNRDLKYGLRSRRWLWTRGAKGNVDGRYEQYVAYVKHNLDRHPEKLNQTDLGVLEGQSADEILETTPPTLVAEPAAFGLSPTSPLEEPTTISGSPLTQPTDTDVPTGIAEPEDEEEDTTDTGTGADTGDDGGGGGDDDSDDGSDGEDTDANKGRYVLNQIHLTALVGGTSSDLDSLDTTQYPIGTRLVFHHASTGAKVAYELVESPDLTRIVPHIVPPVNFNVNTNNRAWELVMVQRSGLACVYDANNPKRFVEVGSVYYAGRGWTTAYGDSPFILSS